MPNEKDAEIKSRYEDYSVEELRATLDAIFDSTDEFSDSDVEKMDEIMAVLDKKDPLTQRYSAEESWKHFQENYREELSRLGVRNTEEVMEEEPEEDTVAAADPAVVIPEASAKRTAPESVATESGHGKGYRRLLHTALIAAAVVAAMVIITVSAAAAGINIWGWVPVWNDSTFRYVPENDASSLSMDIPSALEEYGVECPVFPTWLPDGFVLVEQKIRLNDACIFNAVYAFQDRILSITIKNSNRPSADILEIDNDEPDIYRTHGIDHYIVTNYENTVSTWKNGDYFVEISGRVSFEEMERIIKSIYEQ